MAKVSGGTRRYGSDTSAYRKRMAEVEQMRGSGLYSSVTMFDGGGYVAVEKSTARHSKDELDAASVPADKGYKVVLKNEAGLGMNIQTPDGYVYSVSYEQRTPVKDGENTIRNALFHARDKGADIALFYSKGHVFSRKSVEKGIGLFEQASNYRFKQIIVAADNGHVHRYRHSK